MGLRRTSAISAALSACTAGRMGGFLLAGVLACSGVTAQAARRCYSSAQALHHLRHRTCIRAHVYREINLDDGTRILDLCSPGAADCEFALVSLDRNRKSVGSLKQYVGSDIEVLGTVEPIRGRAEIVLRKAAQVRSRNAREVAAARPRERRVKQDRFRANPTLLKSFNAEQNRAPVSDPAFHGGYSN
uniref:Lipoprotein n=1 Tax=Acidobacterium capsulatum TaxID=33075 RepID=A0A7V4XS86_9BACT